MNKEKNIINVTTSTMIVKKSEIPYYSHCFELDELQGNIVKSVLDYIAVTEDMLLDILKMREIAFNPDDLHEVIKHLSDHEYLMELNVINQENDNHIMTAYSVGRRGLGYLRRCHQDVNIYHRKHIIAIYTESAEKLMKLLNANYLVIRNYPGQKCEIGKMFVPGKQSRQVTEKGRIFRACISFLNAEGGQTIIEPVRRTDREMTGLFEKLERIQKVAICKDSNLKINKENQVVLIAEDTAHIGEIMSVLEGKKYRGFRIVITSDTDIQNNCISYISVADKKREGLWSWLFSA